MTTAFITGIAGQDGYYLTQRLLVEGADVHGLVLDASSPEVDQVPAGVTLHQGDLGDCASMTSLIAAVAPDEIYNLGGISSVAYSWEHPAATGQVSGVGAVGIYEAARTLQDASGRQVRVLQASSAEIFGIPDRTPQTEHTTIAPVTPYGTAKAYAHLTAKAMRHQGLDVSTVILYNHESPRRPETFVTRKITAAAARIARDGSGSIAMGNLDARRDWGWAPDYVDAMIRAIRHQQADDYVIATGRAHSVEDFVAAAFARAGIDDWQAHVTIDPRFVRPVDAAQQVGDFSHAHQQLGWQPTVSFEELVGRMVDHDRDLLSE